MPFQLLSNLSPKGDQPQAIDALVKGLEQGDMSQTLLGVTGSGKTFTVANVIQRVQRPTLVLSHNKTLAAQLYGELKSFFPENSVNYFVSYYDYYQPEAYIPSTNLYIEKDLSINDEIEKLRLKSTSNLLSGRRDVIVVSSVSCIYGLGNPEDFANSIIRLKKGDRLSRDRFLFDLVDVLYSRTHSEFKRGTFRVMGDTVDLFPAYMDQAFRIEFFGDEIERLFLIEPDSGKAMEERDAISIYPANIFVTPKDRQELAIRNIQDELVQRMDQFESLGQYAESKRLKERVEYDLEMIRELGYCSGIENYSRFFDGRKPGTRPYCLLDYFPEDYLTVIDESHVTIPQLRAMYGGDRSRKINLVEYGFRLPSAMDNRPLSFEECEAMRGQTIFVSATPSEYELRQSDGVVVEQVIRPTGLIDPKIEVRPLKTQVDDLLDAVDETVKKGQRVLVTTLTKRMAEELSKYMAKLGIKVRYIHSDVDTLDRVEILRDLRLGVFDVLIGINLLREGLDLPEVALVAILDADKEGFLRNDTSLIQTIGRAARNVDGKVIMYADRITASMRRTIDETERRREKQIAYNKENGITPESIIRSADWIKEQSSVLGVKSESTHTYHMENEVSAAADPVLQYMSKEELNKSIKYAKKNMETASAAQDFVKAAKFRDEMFSLKKLYSEKFESDSTKDK